MNIKKSKKTKQRPIFYLFFKSNAIYVDHQIITTTTTNIRDIRRGLTQAYIWLTQSMLYTEGNSAIYFGYIRGDDYWHYIGELKRIIDAVNEILEGNISVRLPLELWTKEEILNELLEIGSYDLVWYCERVGMDNSDTEKPCGTCIPCMTHAKAILGEIMSGNKKIIPYIPKTLYITRKRLMNNAYSY
jgi:7-cyano-7-deazaguanine synthase in queuosine biosynthesis